MIEEHTSLGFQCPRLRAGNFPACDGQATPNVERNARMQLLKIRHWTLGVRGSGSLEVALNSVSIYDFILAGHNILILVRTVAITAKFEC